MLTLPIRCLLLDVSNDFLHVPAGQAHTMIHPPLGIMTVAAAMRGDFAPEQLDVQCVDVALEGGYAAIDDSLRDVRPHLVGLRALSHCHEQFHEAARLVKAWDPTALVIGGGPYANASPDLIMEDEQFDLVCLTEGEPVMRDLVQLMIDGDGRPDLSALRGVHWRRDDEIVINPAMPQIEDLDTLPFPDYGEIDLDRYAGHHAHTSVLRRYAVTMTSRGCPYKCVYCHVLFGKNFRYRSAENVARELAELHDRHGVRDFLLTDDIFNIHLKHAKAVLRAIIELDIEPRLYFPNGLRGDIMDDEYLDLMAEAGTVEVVYAIEAGTERVQKLIQKNLRLAIVEDSIVKTAERGMVVNAFFMIGFPGETEAEVGETVDLVSRLMDHIHFPYVNIVRAYHGGALYEIAREQGYDEEFLLAHAKQPYGTNESIESELNFLPGPVLKSARLRVAAGFADVERMRRMLPVQRRHFTEAELVRKYSTYFGSPERVAEGFLARIDKRLAGASGAAAAG